MLEHFDSGGMGRIDIENARAALKEVKGEGTIPLREAQKRPGLWGYAPGRTARVTTKAAKPPHGYDRRQVDAPPVPGNEFRGFRLLMHGVQCCNEH